MVRIWHLNAFFLDSSGCKLAAAISGVSSPWSKHSITIEPIFSHPVRVKRNKTYLIQVFTSHHRPQFLLGSYYFLIILSKYFSINYSIIVILLQVIYLINYCFYVFFYKNDFTWRSIFSRSSVPVFKELQQQWFSSWRNFQ